jgi:WD40-like Beta Propeller Repeat
VRVFRRAGSSAIAALLFLGFAIAAGGAAPAQGSPTVPNSLIVFQGRDDHILYTSRTDGSQLTPHFSTCGIATPALSPDGSEVAYQSGCPNDHYQISVAKLDGSNRVDLIPLTTASQGGPRWSPDGTWISWLGPRDSTGYRSLMEARPDGSDVHAVAQGIGGFAWSPDGQEVAYTTPSTCFPGANDLIVAKSDGTDAHTVQAACNKSNNLGTVTDWGPAGILLYNNDGSQPVPAPNHFGVNLIQPDGSGISTIYPQLPEGLVAGPRFSPDGSYLIVSVDAGTDGMWIQYASTDGSQGWTVVPLPFAARNPNWGTIQLDSVPPAVVGTPDRPSVDGWYNAPVTITWSSSDPAASSGNPTIPPVTIASVDGANVVYTSEPSCDPAGNCATGSLALSIDQTPPSVYVAGVSQGATYAVGSAPTPSCAASDPSPGSGLASPAELTVTGGNADGTGTFTATCRASDVAGNSASASASYSVHFEIPGGGFQGNVDNPPILNTGKAGKNYPVHWQIVDASGAYVSDLSVVVSERYMPMDCGAFTSDPTGALVADTSGQSGLRYDSTTNMYLYNWKTPTTPGCYQFFITLTDGNVLTADFQLN